MKITKNGNNMFKAFRFLMLKTPKVLPKFAENIEVRAVQKHVDLVDPVKSFPTNIYLQNLASIQKRTSPLKFDNLAEKSE